MSRLSSISGRDLAGWLQRLAAKVKVATVLGSIPASSARGDITGGVGILPGVFSFQSRQLLTKIL